MGYNVGRRARCRAPKTVTTAQVDEYGCVCGDVSVFLMADGWHKVLFGHFWAMAYGTMGFKRKINVADYTVISRGGSRTPVIHCSK